MRELKEQIKVAEKPLHLADPIPNNLIKAYYTMRYLRSRDCKVRLLHTLNYFRSVQKRMALDLKELFTRNRGAKIPNEAEIIGP